MKVELIGTSMYPDEYLSVIGAHLTSGDNPSDEIQRMKEVLEPTLERNGELTGASLREWFEESTQMGACLLCVDANTYPDKDGDQTMGDAPPASAEDKTSGSSATRMRRNARIRPHGSYRCRG